MIGVEPYNMKYITDEKAMYAAIFIAGYRKLVGSVALKLLVQVCESVRFRSAYPIYAMRL
jgi:hypothetical protein